MTVLPFLAFAIPIAERRPQNVQQQQVQRQHHRLRHHLSPFPPPLQQLRATLRVCTDEDCIQQGAYQTLATLKKEAKGEEIQVLNAVHFCWARSRWAQYSTLAIMSASRRYTTAVFVCIYGEEQLRY